MLLQRVFLSRYDLAALLAVAANRSVTGIVQMSESRVACYLALGEGAESIGVVLGLRATAVNGAIAALGPPCRGFTTGREEARIGEEVVSVLLQVLSMVDEAAIVVCGIVGTAASRRLIHGLSQARGLLLNGLCC